MARILLSKLENDFLRELLIASIRETKQSISADIHCIENASAEALDIYKDFLKNDSEKLEMAESIYNNLLNNL